MLERYQPSADEKAIQGDWSVAGQVVDGKVLPNSEGPSAPQFRFSDNFFRQPHLSGGMGPSDLIGDLFYGVFALNPGSTPKSITLFNNPLIIRNEASRPVPGRSDCPASTSSTATG